MPAKEKVTQLTINETGQMIIPDEIVKAEKAFSKVVDKHLDTLPYFEAAYAAEFLYNTGKGSYLMKRMFAALQAKQEESSHADENRG